MKTKCITKKVHILRSSAASWALSVTCKVMDKRDFVDHGLRTIYEQIKCKNSNTKYFLKSLISPRLIMSPFQ